MLHCSNDTYYTGCTTDLEQRIYDHRIGKYNGYSKRRRPLKLLWFFKAFVNVKQLWGNITLGFICKILSTPLSCFYVGLPQR